MLCFGFGSFLEVCGLSLSFLFFLFRVDYWTINNLVSFSNPFSFFFQVFYINYYIFIFNWHTHRVVSINWVSKQKERIFFQRFSHCLEHVSFKLRGVNLCTADAFTVFRILERQLPMRVRCGRLCFYTTKHVTVEVVVDDSGQHHTILALTAMSFFTNSSGLTINGCEFVNNEGTSSTTNKIEKGKHIFVHS